MGTIDDGQGVSKILTSAELVGEDIALSENDLASCGMLDEAAC